MSRCGIEKGEEDAFVGNGVEALVNVNFAFRTEMRGRGEALPFCLW